MKITLLIVVLSIGVASVFDFSYSEKAHLLNEIENINKEVISDPLYLFPAIKKNKKSFLDLYKKSEDLSINPIFATRYSSSSFEIFQSDNIINSDLLWITPGLEFDFSKAFVFGFTGLWVQGWSRFNKHSAFGFNNNTAQRDLLMFPYNPNFSFENYFLSQKPENGVDFDEGEGAIAIITPWADLIYGKFRSRLGPFSNSNLSISNQTPGFSQVHVRIKSDKAKLTFIAGELYSGLFEPIDYYDFDEEGHSNADWRFKKISRYMINHRIDYKIKENLRIGFYEQIIVGHKLPLLYLVPTMPFWSAQHSLGDTDNLQMGFDVDYINNKNRLYFAFLMDEWAPYDTFNLNHHNWFAMQLGFSRTFRHNMLFKIEYARLEPQIYMHDFPINMSYNYNYPVGYWSGGDSEDIFLMFFCNLKNNQDFKFIFRHTNIGNPEYSVNSDFLEVTNIKTRTAYEFKFNKGMNTKIGLINYLFTVKSITSKNIYDIDNFMDYQFSMLYNINY